MIVGRWKGKGGKKYTLKKKVNVKNNYRKIKKK